MTLSSGLDTVTESGGVLIKYGGGQSQFQVAQCNGSDIFLTAAVTYQNETNRYDIDLAAAGERVDGIVVAEAYPYKVDLTKDSDSCFADDTWVIIYRPIAQDMLYATVASATSITKDDWVKYSDGFLTSATNKNDAIGKLEHGGAAVSGASNVEVIVSITWGTD
jgi:hypothetical protein